MKIVRRVAIAAIVIAAVAVAVRLSMPWMARRLVRSDPLTRSDLIVVLGGFRLERTLDAGMLFREGYAPRILLLRPPDLIRDRLRRELALHLPVLLDVQHDVLRQMGVPEQAILDAPRVEDSTRGEAVIIGSYVRQHGYRNIIVITSPYHTGRAGALIDKAAAGAFHVAMRADRYEPYDAERWWVRYPDRSDVVFEYLKTVYAWRYPVSGTE